MLIGAFLRFYGLGTESLWYDETTTVYSASKSIRELLGGCLLWQRQPPLYFVVLKVWMIVFGDGEVAVRALSAVIGTITVPVIFLVGRSLFNERVGLIAGFLSSISYYFIRFSQECRDYSLLLFFSLVSFYCFVQLFKIKENYKRYYIFWAVANVFLVYSHYFGLFVVASQVFYYLIFYKRIKGPLRYFWYSILGTFLVFLPWGIAFAIISVPHSFTMGKPGPGDLIATLQQYSGYENVQPWMVLIFGCLCLVGLFRWARVNSRQENSEYIISFKLINYRVTFEWEVLLLIIWFVFPFFAPYLIAQIPHHIAGIYVSKYTISAMPAFYILVSRGLERLLVKKYLYPLFCFFIVLLTVLSGLGLQKYYTSVEKEQWRETVSYLEPQLQESDVVVLSQGFLDMAVQYYSVERITTDSIPSGMVAERIDKYIVEGKTRMWLIQNKWTTTKTLDYMLRTYEEDRILMHKHFVLIDVYLFDLSVSNGERMK